MKTGKNLYQTILSQRVICKNEDPLPRPQPDLTRPSVARAAKTRTGAILTSAQVPAQYGQALLGDKSLSQQGSCLIILPRPKCQESIRYLSGLHPAPTLCIALSPSFFLCLFLALSDLLGHDCLLILMWPSLPNSEPLSLLPSDTVDTVRQ
jgi:hypothetical protein